MKIILLSFIVLLSACSVTIEPPEVAEILRAPESTPIPCIDHLGCGNATYAKNAVKIHPRGSAFRCFTQKNLFGPNSYKVFNEAMASGKVPLVGFSLNWSDNHSTGRRDFPKIIQEAKRFIPLVNKYTDVACEFIGITEHTLNASDATDLANMVLSVVPERCIYVNNPWVGNGSFIKPTARIRNEVHGKDANKPNIGGWYSWSADGSDVFDFDPTGIKNKMPDAYMMCGWTSQNNGKRNAGDTTPRPNRIYWPTLNLIQMIDFVMTTVRGEVLIPKNHTIKPKSDQHSVPPSYRELKPVFIFPEKVDRVQMRGGGKVFTSEKGQSFADGRTRFYFSEMHGYQYVKKAGVAVFDIGYMTAKKVWKSICKANPGFRGGGDR